MAVVMGELRSRGLAFLNTRTIAATVASQRGGPMNMPDIDRDVFIDNDKSVEAVLRQLVETEHVAEPKGFALAIGHPHLTTIASPAGMVADAEGKGFVLMPASSLVHMELSSAG